MGIIKTIHVSLALLSFSGFVVRGFLIFFDSSLVRTFWVKRLPHLIDTVLLLSGLTLVIILGISPVEHTWLAVKLVALIFYIAFGLIAFRFAKNNFLRIVSWLTAIAIFLFIAATAMSKKPLFFA